MKSILKILLLILLSNKMHSQSKVFSIEEAQKMGISIEKLDLEYKSAVHTNSTKNHFQNRSTTTKIARILLKIALRFWFFLNKNSFKWGTKTKRFLRIYFAPNGKTDYFIYNFKLKKCTS